MDGDGKVLDEKVASTIALYVPTGTAPTPFVSLQKFRVDWAGFLRADVAETVSFQAELNGSFTLEINGTKVLDVASTGGPTRFSEPVLLKKGLNIVRATFNTPITGPAFVRLNTSSTNGVARRLDERRLSYSESGRGQTMRMGMHLFVNHRCARCHSTSISSGTPDLQMEAPNFENIGGRLREGWMAHWIANPKAMRSDAHMPRLRKASRPENAQAMATFLASLGARAHPKLPKLTPAEAKQAKQIFEKQRCDVCHFTENAGIPDAQKVSLRHVAAKYFPDALIAYLQQPDAHYKWTAMPNYQLSQSDCDVLARWLILRSDAPLVPDGTSSPETIERGKHLVQTVGCLNCHALNLANQFLTKPLAQIERSTAGCVGNDPAADYAFTIGERNALQMWLPFSRASLSRDVPVAFAERHATQLKCESCHREPMQGAKLAFPKFANEIAKGLAMQNGYPPTNTPAHFAW